MVLYNLGIYIFGFILNLASLFKVKAKQWVSGRKDWQLHLREQVSKFQLQQSIWVHCASLGEFEQGRPVIEKLKQDYPDQKIVLTFFSPSGYEIQKNYPIVDYVCYLPLDTKKNAKEFLHILNPKLAIFVKYEFWLNYLFELHKKRIPTFLISTVIKKHQSFFKWYGTYFKRALKTYRIIFAQDQASLDLLQTLDIQTGKIAGDTRFDRVLKVLSAPKKISEIEQFSKDNFVLIAGSSWQKDEELIIESYLELKPKYPNLKLILAPHEIDKNNIYRLSNLLSKHKIAFHLFSENVSNYTHSVLIINGMGFLSSIYQYGSLAFVGGGFNNGIHNLLEPSAFGLPVLFGPNYQKYNEAFDVIDEKCGFVILSAAQLTAQLTYFLNNEAELKETSARAKNYVLKHSGATDTVTENLKKYLIQDRS